jgi:surface protein
MLQKARLLGRLNEFDYLRQKTGIAVSYFDLSDSQHIIHIPEGVTDFKNHGKVGMFSTDGGESDFDDYLMNIQGELYVLGGGDLTNIDNLFFKCSADVIDLVDFDTKNVVSMNGLFLSCSAQEIILSNFNTSKVKQMQFMFYGVGLNNLDLSNFDTTSVENMTSMFESAIIDKLDLSSFNTKNVTAMEQMFKGCKASHIGLKSFKPKNLLQCEDMFLNCNANILTSAESLNLIYNRLHKERVRPR